MQLDEHPYEMEKKQKHLNSVFDIFTGKHVISISACFFHGNTCIGTHLKIYFFSHEILTMHRW